MTAVDYARLVAASAPQLTDQQRQQLAAIIRAAKAPQKAGVGR